MAVVSSTDTQRVGQNLWFSNFSQRLYAIPYGIPIFARRVNAIVETAHYSTGELLLLSWPVVLLT